VRKKQIPIAPWFAGEALGTFLLVFFGCGSVATSVLTGALTGGFQVAIVWGIGIAVAIHLTGSLSGAHLNPAITVAFALGTDFPWKRVPRYFAAQCFGAFAASLVLYAVFHNLLATYEAAHGIVRGAPGSEATAMIFGEFFPNPGGRPLTAARRAAMPMPAAFFAEFCGTAILALVILACSDPRNRARPKALAPAVIGLTVTLLISLFSPLTMACFNPARDLAPRVFSALAGWNLVPFTTNGSGWLTVYVLAPIVGGLAGSWVYRRLAPLYVGESKRL
jgi:glycerol uptake facilitator protein